MDDPDRERLKAVADRWMDEVWQRGRAEAVLALHSPHFVDRSAPPGRTTDRQGFKRGVEECYAAFPDFRAETKGLVIDEEAGEVAIRWTATGTHSGPFAGVPPTGRPVRVTGIEVLRIEGDRIVERWGEWDGIGLLQQLGGLLGA